MSQKEVTQIKISNRSTGIIGLKQVLKDMAEEYAHRPDEEVRNELLDRLSKSNYIPASARDEYGRAFLREFRKSVGQPYEEDVSQGLEIKVVGPGCAQCDRLEMTVMEVLAELQLPANVEHVRDIKEIGRMGIMGTPALMIGGQVKVVGSVPPKNKIMDWLKEAGKKE